MHQHSAPVQVSAYLQTFVSRTRLAVQRAEDMTAMPFEEDNISVVPSDQGQAPGQHLFPDSCAPQCVCCPIRHFMHACNQAFLQPRHW